MDNYKTKSPVLFLIFNRPDVTLQVFEQIKKVRPSKLYIAADGPRKNRDNESNLCLETRNIIKNIDWDCEIKTLFREENLGCKYAVSSSIDWFFQNEEEGIILEDDCKPSEDFFIFCDTMLEKYRFDQRIGSITGTNLQNGVKHGLATYYFSYHNCVWGWASWRRVWNNYDVELSRYNEQDASFGFKNIFDNELISNPWQNIFKELKSNKIDTWDYQFSIMNFFNNNLSIVPNVNLISNIGFNENATHTFDKSNPNSNISFGKLELIIKHPHVIVPNREADYAIFNIDFDIEINIAKGLDQHKPKKVTLYKKIKKYIRSIKI
jgi:hypothetical protein